MSTPFASPAAGGAGPTAGPGVDLQAIVYASCRAEQGGCACKIKGTNLARPAGMFGAESRGARCDERYNVALSTLCAIAKAGGDVAAVEAVTKLASAPDLAARNAALEAALRGMLDAAQVVMSRPADPDAARQAMRELTRAHIAGCAALDGCGRG